MNGSYLGPSFSDEQIESKIRGRKYLDINEKTAGWFQGGRMEQLRALRARSIIAIQAAKCRKNLIARESLKGFKKDVLTKISCC